MLLLVIQAQFDQRVDARRQYALAHELGHRRIDVRTRGANFLQRWSRQQSAPGAGMLLADTVVVGIEQHAKRWMEHPVPGQMRDENERLEEPARMREMPLDRTRIGHRLDRAILR